MFCKNCGTQISPGVAFCKACGQNQKLPAASDPAPANGPDAPDNNSVSWTRKYGGALIILGGFILIVVLSAASWSGKSEQEDVPVQAPAGNQADRGIVFDPAVQREIARSVVNIFCESTEAYEEGSGGSGTIMDESGVILTNSHIIPQDEVYLHVGEEGCLVILPDPQTGQPQEMYWAEPVVIPSLSDNYDLAYMNIYAAYYDEEDGEYMGTYPRQFPAFDDSSRCQEEEVQLGEPIRIFGYPAISGGYSLTVTDGVVSSFPGDGFIVTSAKISHGNSGGLAVDRFGCMIGIPSMTNSDDTESLGIITSMSIINEFSEKVVEYLES